MLREAFLNFPGRRVGGGGRVSPRPKKIKEMYEAELEFPEEVGRRSTEKSLQWGRYGYFLKLLLYYYCIIL